MPLLPPRVLGPLSECSARVRVQGQLTGSTVVVLANGDVVAKAVAPGPDQWLELDQGQALVAGASVTAFQEFAGETSQRSTDAVLVQKRPRRLGRLSYVSKLWVGGQCLLLAGAVPGAEVTIKSSGGSYTGTADDGTVIIGRKPLAAGEIMRAHQDACGATGPETASVAPDRLPPGFSTPGFAGPLAACQTQIVVTGAVDGSGITVTRSGGGALSGCFPTSSGIVQLDTPLEEHEILAALMELPDGSPIGQSRPFAVGPRPAEPEVVGDLCAGTTHVRVMGTTRGQRISVLQDGDPLGTTEMPGAGFVIQVPPLRAGARVRLAYDLCGDQLTTRREWAVGAAPAAIRAPRIPGPVVACGEAVLVDRVRPGARVLVVSRQLGAPIGEAFAESTTVTVPVAPLLIAGDRLTAAQTGCGKTSRPSAAAVVSEHGTLARPVIQEPLVEGRRSVTVTGVVPGARVELYVQGLFEAAALASASSVQVAIPTGHLPLLIDQKVEVRERLCDQAATSATAVVRPEPPVIHFGAVPMEIAADETATLVWRVDHADRVAIDHGIGRVAPDGSAPVTPTSTTTYRLTAGHGSVLATTETTVTVRPGAPPPPPFQTILLQPVAPGGAGGNEGWQGLVAVLNHTAILQAIENPHPDITLHLLKAGQGFEDCNEPDAVVVLGPHGRTQPADLEPLFGSPAPQLVSGQPLLIRACASGNVVGPTGIPIAIAVNAYLRVT